VFASGKHSWMEGQESGRVPGLFFLAFSDGSRVLNAR